MLTVLGSGVSFGWMLCAMLVSVSCPCFVLTVFEVNQWRIRVLASGKSTLSVIDCAGFVEQWNLDKP